MEVPEKIIVQSAELFIRSGIKSITMDDISREAGISKRTIYENFKDKDDLLRSCLNYLDNSYKNETEEIIKNSENVIDTVFRILKHGIKVFATINPLFFTDLKKYHFNIWIETHRINNEKYLEQTHSLVKKGINEGFFRKNINIDIVTTLLHEQLKILSDEQIFPSGKYSKSVVFENIMINFIRGIATQKGISIIENY